MAGEGEGEPQWQSSTFHSHVVQEVRDAMHNVVKELEGDKFLLVSIVGVWLAFLWLQGEETLELFQSSFSHSNVIISGRAKKAN